MRIIYFIICLALFTASCGQKPIADSLFFNGKINMLDSNFTVVEAMAVHNGRIVAVGTKSELLKRYQFLSQTDLNQQFVYPGIIDAHCHFYGLGTFMQMVDLTACKSFSEVVDACIKFYARNPQPFILGRGWDQNKWENQQYPDNNELNQAFPDIPVLLKRVDGHAAIANDAALKLAGFTVETTIYGGELLKKDNKLTGVLIDNAADSLQSFFPKPNRSQIAVALLKAQEICFDYGITGVHDAGLEPEVIEVIDSLHNLGVLKMRIVAMVSISNNNIAWLKQKGGIKTNWLNVNSFKMYADGALGSRGALLLEPYSDAPKNHGLMLTDANQMENWVKEISNTPFQLNTHCIGDSANRFILSLYGKYLGEKNTRRWRIEHAQVIHENDFELFKKFGIIPSVQPTHATSDMHWAEQRIGKNRIKTAYAYKLLMQQNGWIPLGTDFPVEQVSPFFTFDAAVSRQDEKGFPIGGFEPTNALSRKDALLGITLWPAMAAFEENEKGTLEPNKYADFIVTDVDLLKDDLHKIRNLKPLSTYVNGIKVK
jgi:predicted amidohydrolase YtcJ